MSTDRSRDDEQAETPARRILVALDASDPDLGSLEAAADVAARMGAELVAVFVEDIDLLRLAALPFAQEYSPYARRGRGIDGAAMERMLRAQAASLRRAVEAAAERRRVRWTFRVSRGAVARELLAAAEDVDMLVVGRSCRPGRRAARVGSTTRTVVRESNRTVIVLHPGGDIGRPVLVVYDGSTSAARALVVAARIAHDDHKNVVVALTAEDLAEPATAVMNELGIRPRLVKLDDADLVHLLATVTREQCRSLVVGVDSTVLQRKAAADLVENARCPVIIVP